MKEKGLCIVSILLLLCLLVFTAGCDRKPELFILSIEIEPATGGTVEPEGGEFEAGTVVILEISPAKKFQFKEWAGEHGDEVTYDAGEWKLLMDGDKQISAVFEDKEISLTVSPESAQLVIGEELVLGVIVEPDDANVSFASNNEGVAMVDADGKVSAISKGEVTITIQASKEDYNDAQKTVAVSVLLKDLEQVSQPVWDEDIIRWNDLANAVNYEVKFYRNAVLVSTETVGQGVEEYNFAPDMVAFGSGEYSVTIQALGDGIEYKDGLVSQPSVVRIKHTLNVLRKGKGTVNPEEGVHLYTKDEEVNLQADPKVEWAWEFSTWDGDVDEPEEAETTIVMDEDKTVTAVFTGGFAGGSGTVGDPYWVADADQLNNVRGHLDKHFIQTADIDLSDFITGEGWEPIGTQADDLRFTGSFDGVGYTISNLYINRPEEDYVGLFGVAWAGADDGVIENVALDNVQITGKNSVGGLVGQNASTVNNSYAEGAVLGNAQTGGLVGRNEPSGVITSSHATGDVESTGANTGGLVGHNYGTVTSSSAGGAVDGFTHTGGLVGKNEPSGVITACHATGDVSSISLYTGGLLGFNAGEVEDSYATGDVNSTGNDTGGLVGVVTATVTNSYAVGAVSGDERVGGLVGNNYGVITNTYAVGLVSGSGDLGGLVGSDSGTVTDSYYDTETTQQDDDEGKGKPKLTVEMMQKSTFEPEWDFKDIWDIDDGFSYPYLQWE